MSLSVFQNRMSVKKLPHKTVTIRSMKELRNADLHIEDISVPSYCCNETGMLDLSRFVNLNVLNVEDYSFMSVIDVKLCGLKKLEKVRIGMNCFLCNDDVIPNHHFYLKDCERLNKLKIGCCSFTGFTVCEITNMPSLQVINIGELNKTSFDFQYASLELKSDGDGLN